MFDIPYYTDIMTILRPEICTHMVKLIDCPYPVQKPSGGSFQNFV